MKVFWDEVTIRFMMDASEHSTYNKAIAAWISQRLPRNVHICDAGCGLGYLSLELAKCAQKVTAVDVSRQALDVLQSNCAAKGIGHIEIRCGDIAQLLPGEKYDAMVFCMFGDGAEGMRIAKAQCRGDVFMVLRNYPSHRFSVNTHRMEYKGFREACRLLNELSVPYESEALELDMGQPFRSFEDARVFFRRYSRDLETCITDAFLECKLQRTNRDDFPYYMPHKKSVGILHFKTRDIPQDIEDIQ